MITKVNLKQFDEIYNKTYNQTLKYIICKCSNIEDGKLILTDNYLNKYYNKEVILK